MKIALFCTNVLIVFTVLSYEPVANVVSNMYLLLVLCNVQAYIKMLFRVTC